MAARDCPEGESSRIWRKSSVVFILFITLGGVLQALAAIGPWGLPNKALHSNRNRNHRKIPPPVEDNSQEDKPWWWQLVRGGAGSKSARSSPANSKTGRSSRGRNSPSLSSAAGKRSLSRDLHPEENEEVESDLGTLVIDPETGRKVGGDDNTDGDENDEGSIVHEDDVELEGLEESEEDTTRGFASGGSGDDDDDLNDEGGGGGGESSAASERWSYLEEVELEEEPEWVAAYAALEDSIEDPPQDEMIESREQARGILRQAWARAATAPPHHDTNALSEADDEPTPLPFTRQSKAAARRELYKAFLRDLNTDTRTFGGRHWLDRDALVHLRGTALLCQRPEYGELLQGLNPRFARGVRLVVPTATHGMQEALAAALAHSVGAVLVVADHRRIAAVRRIALEEGVPKKFLGSDMVLGALLDLAREEESELNEDEEEEEEEGEDEEVAGITRTSQAASSSPPLVIFLADKARPFIQSKTVADSLHQLLHSRSTKSFFLLASEFDPDSQLPSSLGASLGGIGGLPGSMNGMSVAEAALQNITNLIEERGGPNGGNLPRLGGLPNGMPWPGMGPPPNFNKGGPVLHVMIRPNMMPPPPGANGTINYMAMPGPAALFKKTVAELAEHFHELSKERLTESSASGKQGGGEGQGGEEEEEKEDEAEEEDDEDQQEFKDRAAAESSALAQLASMLELLNNNENFHHALQQHHMQTMSNMAAAAAANQGQGGGAGGRPGLPQMPPGMMPGGPQQQQPPMGPDGQPLFSGPMMMPAYQITFAFPPLQPPPSMRGQPSTSAATGSNQAAAPASQQAGQASQGLPFARWFQKNRDGSSSAADEGSGSSNSPPTGGRGKKRKGRRAAAAAAVPSVAKQQHQDPSAPPMDQPLSGPEQEELLSMFEDVVLNPTKEAALKARWDKLVMDDNERVNAKRTWAILRQALSAHHLICPELSRSHPLLYKVALKPGQEVAKVMMTAIEVDISRRALPQIMTEEGTQHVLSLEGLETALAMVCKASLPRPGVPVSRTKDEVTALATNRHEHALVGNVISPQDIGVTYDQIGGLTDVKETLRQCVTYPLRFPHLYSEGIAADSVKGVLLFGPPGTGKTMLAKAVATEGGATFLSVDASVIESKWLGESEKNAKAVFTLARRLAPCVIYLDEVDSILSSRDQGEDTKYNTITSVKTTFMQEWDGLRTTSDRVIVVASTNRPYALDQAVLRRMPRRILVDLPDLATREEMLKVILENNRVAPEVNLTTIAKRLEGYTGSDIREVCREAVVRIAHEESKKLDGAQGVELGDLGKRLRAVTKADFDAALEKLSASVAARGRELERVREWNNQFGEVRKKTRPPHMSMYL